MPAPKEPTTLDLIADSPVKYGFRITTMRNWYAVPAFGRIERELDLTESEITVIFCLGHIPALRAKDVSVISARPKNSISRGVHLLLRKKLAQQNADRADKREKTLTLTSSGLAMFRKIMPIFQARQDAMLSALTARERQSFDRLLDKLLAGLDSREAVE
jgi:MarR family transcriptional regulator, temperature-dependent positive regulator of motility